MAAYVPRQGDIISITFDPQSGHEQKGRRPALVVSKDLFNRSTGVAIVCPVTNTERGFPFHVPAEGHDLSCNLGPHVDHFFRFHGAGGADRDQQVAAGYLGRAKRCDSTVPPSEVPGGGSGDQRQEEQDCRKPGGPARSPCPSVVVIRRGSHLRFGFKVISHRFLPIAALRQCHEICSGKFDRLVKNPEQPHLSL